MSAGDLPNDEVVTTVYINGFPDDFKERELQNMFIFARGFEGCSLRIPTGNDHLQIDIPNSPPPKMAGTSNNCRQILGFVRFSTLLEALEACQLLNGRIIDSEKGYTLRAELAKKNLVIGNTNNKNSKSHSNLISGVTVCGLDFGTSGNLFGPNLVRRQSSGPTSCLDQQTTTMENSNPPRSLSLAVPGSPTPIAVTVPTIRSQAFILNENVKAGSNLLNSMRNPIANDGNGSGSLCGLMENSPGNISSTIPMENPPCNTLYIGNLPVNASELELRSIFAMMPGFRRMSFKTKQGGSPMCFVEFEDITNATHAMHALYGTMLSNSVKGGIRISFSKNPLGMRSNPQAMTNLFLGSSLYQQVESSIANDIQMIRDPFQTMASYSFPGIIDG